QVVASQTHTNAACFGGNRSATISATGGTPPYTGTGTFSQAAGTVVYTVTDANGCTATVSVTVTQPTQLSASETHTNAACFGGSGARKSVVKGGTLPYRGTGTFSQEDGTEL